ncbi:hypothetical protein [Subtercola sp. RTI3]|uniref:hypothetical protein n=1 Tax=Subtercola sp. RTI3 TaxID=3048639 RepID=UPI002B239D3D|nr:hypothetical protein [Subtercola sp. RTI3]MEA9987264.1 hypothetical protein [Subtercola sp. RTI3]
MFNTQRVHDLAEQITAITEAMTVIANEQRDGIIENEHDQLARMNTLLTSVMATQTQLVKLIGTLTGTFIEYLLDEEQQHQLGLTE